MRERCAPRARWPWSACLLLALAWTWLASPVSAQLLETETISEQDGLRGSAITSLGQTRDGRMWFVGRGNISVWDGMRWSHFSPGEELPPEFVGTWLVADRNDVWVVSERLRNGMLHKRQDGWTAIERPEDVDLDDMVHGFAGLRGERSDLRLALAFRSQLRFFEPQTGTWSRAEITDSEVAGPIVGTVALGGELYVARANSVEHISEGELTSRTMFTLDDPEDRILGVYPEQRPDGLRRIWVVSRSGLQYFEGGELVLVSNELPDLWVDFHTVATLRPDGWGGLYFGTWTTLLHYDSRLGTIRRQGPNEGFVSDGATAIIEDRDRNLWFACMRGVTRVPPQQFKSWTARQGLLEDEVTSIERLPDGRLALGHHVGVTLLGDRTLESFALREVHPLGMRLGRVLDLELAPSGEELWVASSSHGLARVALEAGQPAQELEVDWIPYELDTCNAVLVDREGEVLLGTSRGVWRVEGDRLVSEATPFQNRAVRRLFETSDGILFASLANHGLFSRPPGGEWTLAAGGVAFSDLNVFALEEDSEGRIWIGGLSGLHVLGPDGLSAPAPAPDIDIPVYSLLEASDGALWMGTSFGVKRWKDGVLSSYGPEDGLAGPEANRDALYEDDEGRIWIGTDSGLSCFLGDPQFEPRPLDVELLETIGLEHERPSDSLFEPHADLEFHFRVVTFEGDRQVSYRARLIGYDEDWLPARPLGAGELRYTNLPPGDYQLELQARSRRSDWGPVTRSERFEFVAPLWRRAWFQWLVLGSIGLFLASLLGLANARRRGRRLEAQVLQGNAQLAESERRYREMFQNNPAIQLLLEPSSGRVLEANAAAVEYFGNSNEEIRDLSLPELTGMSAEEFAAGFHRLEASGEWVCRPCDEDPLYGPPIEIRASLFALRGERIVQVTIYDIEIRQRLEHQLLEASKLRAVGELASGVAHDFNNLLTAILGHNELLALESAEDARYIAHVDNIRQAGERGATLVKQLLAFGRKQQLRFEEFELNPVIRNTTGILQSVLGARIRVELDLEDGAGRICADRSQIERILMNLTLNARDAMPSGGTLTLRTRIASHSDAKQRPEGLDPSRDYVQVSVQDTGVGMSEEERAQMFEPFFTTKSLGKGTGLGLSLVRSIVIECQGTTHVESSPGEGTKIHLYLPLIESAPRGALPSAGIEEPATDLTVLLVEDEDSVRATIEALLTGSGHRVLVAGSAEEARARFAERADEVDVLLTDMNLPAENGRSLALALREAKPGLQVLYMSGLYDEALADERETFIHKPFSLDKLQQALSRVQSV